jgi:hypothetical protein
LVARLVDGLQRGSFEIVSPEQVMAAVPNADTCDKDRCFKKIAESTGASHVVRAEVTVRDRDYAIKVFLIDGEDGTVLATNQEGCEICGVADVGAMISSAAATLRTKLDSLAQGPATLVLGSDPNGATVQIDGEIVGVTPLDRPVIAGKHVVRVSKEGYIGIEREVTFVEGVEEKLDFKLDKLPSRLPSRGWGWASLGVGIAGLGAGVGLMVASTPSLAPQFHPDCSGENLDDAGNCRYLWDFRWPAFAAGVAGAALLTLGIAVLVNSGKTKKQKAGKQANRPNRPNVGVGFGSVVLTGRF